MRGDPKYVYLAYVEDDRGPRVVVRGVYGDRDEAARLPPLKGETNRNLVGVFEDVDMGMHVGFRL